MNDKPGGFFLVFSEAFAAILKMENGDKGSEEGLQELEDFGLSKAPDDQVTAFYSSWNDFQSRRAFGFVEKWKLNDAENRQIRRLMEKDNKKDRDKARREYRCTCVGVGRCASVRFLFL